MIVLASYHVKIVRILYVAQHYFLCPSPVYPLNTIAIDWTWVVICFWIVSISNSLCFSDTYEKERGRLQSANQDMAGQIERLKDQLSSHKEEAQKYKQKCITLEQRLIETEARLNKSEESQMSHDNIQDKLHKRCYIQDYIGIESVIIVRSA